MPFKISGSSVQGRTLSFGIEYSTVQIMVPARISE